MTQSFRLLVCAVALVLPGVASSEVKAAWTLTLTTPSGSATAPSPNNMAAGGTIVVSGYCEYTSIFDYDVIGVMIPITGPDGRTYFSGNATGFNPTTYAFTQSFTLPNDDRAYGTWKVFALGFTKYTTECGDTKYFSVPRPSPHYP